MKVSVQQVGGIAPLNLGELKARQEGLSSSPAELDGDALSEPERAELVRLVDSAAHATSPASTQRVADRSGHRITIRDRDRTQVISAASAGMAPEVARLLEWILSRAKR